MECKEDREKVLVPVLRRESVQKKELPEELSEDEAKVWEVPRRWRIQ